MPEKHLVMSTVGKAVKCARQQGSEFIGTALDKISLVQNLNQVKMQHDMVW